MLETTRTVEVLVTFGGLFLVGLLADLAGRNTPLPRVTLLLVSGFVIGPSGLDWLPAFTDRWFPILTNIALAMIGFLLGQNMTRTRFGALDRSVLVMSIGEALMTALLVFTVLALAGVAVEVALLLAGVAPATAPASIVDVVRESGAKGRFTDSLLGIMTVDNAWGLMIFSLVLAAVHSLSGTGPVGDVVLAGVWEIAGALLLGCAIGLPMAYLTNHIPSGEPSQAKVLGLVTLTAGIAEWIAVSYILSAIVLGAVVANLARDYELPFRVIQDIQWPFLILFFLLAGAALHVDALGEASVLIAAYMALRIVGRILGTRLGGSLSGADPRIYRWMGLALLPQAGVAIGMALLAGQQFPEIRDVILPVVLGSTAIFEVVGPVITRWALRRVGDAPPGAAGLAE